MAEDPVESPLGVRGRAGTDGNNAAGSVEDNILDANGARELLAAAPLSVEVAALARWFDALPGAERAAVVSVLIEKCPAVHTPLLTGALHRSRQAGSGSSSNHGAGPSGKGFGPGSHEKGMRLDLFHQFQAVSDIDSTNRHAQGSSETGRRANSTGNAGSTSANSSVLPTSPNLHAFRPLKGSNNGSGSPFAMNPVGSVTSVTSVSQVGSVNSFISPAGGDLYSQAFMPFSGGGARQFTPWSLSQEIGRPKSAATDSLPNPSNNFSPYHSGSAWSATGSAPGTASVVGTNTVPSSTPGAIGSNRDNRSWSGPRRGVTPGTPSTPGTPGTIGSGVPMFEPSGGTKNGGSVGHTAIGQTASVTGPGARGGSDSARSSKNGSASAPGPASTASAAPTGLGAVASVSSQKWARPSSLAPSSPNLSAYASKRGVDYVDPELLQDVGAWLRSLRLHKYTENFNGMDWQDVVQLDEAALEARGVNAMGARRKMLKMFETIRIAQDIGKLPK